VNKVTGLTFHVKRFNLKAEGKEQHQVEVSSANEVVDIYRAFETVRGNINISAKHIVHCKICDFTAVTMRNGVFWDVTPCGSCKDRRF
jgi:hypothetical protein